MRPRRSKRVSTSGAKKKRREQARAKDARRHFGENERARPPSDASVSSAGRMRADTVAGLRRALRGRLRRGASGHADAAAQLAHRGRGGDAVAGKARPRREVLHRPDVLAEEVRGEFASQRPSAVSAVRAACACGASTLLSAHDAFGSVMRSDSVPAAQARS